MAIALSLSLFGCAGDPPVIIEDDPEQVVTRTQPAATTTSATDGVTATDPTAGTTTAGTSAATTTTTAGTTAPTKKPQQDTVGDPVKADVRVVNGTPRLFINGQATTGNLFFLNGDTLGTSAKIYTSEVGRASANGIHIYSTIYNVAYKMKLDGDNKIKYSGLCRLLDNILDADPQAKILLRVSVYAAPTLYEDGAAMFADGSQSGNVTMASDAWEKDTIDRIKDMIAYIRSVPKYAASVYGYHLDNREWFPDYFTAGPDISAANSRKFRQWLTEKYKTDAALRTAWHDETAALSAAVVPKDLPVNGSSDRHLLVRDTDRRYTDYLRYWSELTASRIEAFAKAIKQASNNESVVIAFYGYYFEQYHATTGHWDFRRLLDSPYLDGFASPTSYMDRNAGKSALTATSGYMTTADTVARAGKLWIMESDERTFINRTIKPQDTVSYPPLKSIDDILSVHKREMGQAAVHGTTMYPMDLSGLGWYDADEIWENFGQLDRALLRYQTAQKERSRFDVALVVDEKASALVGASHSMLFPSLAQSMLNIYRAGVSFGLVEMDDVLNGRADDYKVYLFVTPYGLTSENVDKLCKTMHRDNKLAVYLYGFGKLSDADASRLTGMTLTSTAATAQHGLQTLVQDKLTGLKKLIGGVNGNTRTVCSGYTAAIGKYQDGSIGFAAYEAKDWRSVFLGTNELSAETIRSLARYGGANIFSEGDDVVTANQNMLVLSAKTNGSKTLHFAEKVDVYDYFNDRWYQNVDTVTLRGFMKGDTAWVFYGKKADIEAMHLPKWTEV